MYCFTLLSSAVVARGAGGPAWKVSSGVPHSREYVNSQYVLQPIYARVRVSDDPRPAGSGFRLSAVQKLLLSFIYVRSLNDGQLIDFCIDGKITRDKGEQKGYKNVEHMYNTLNFMLRTRESAYAAALKARNKRSLLHVCRPKKRMPKKPVPVSGEVQAVPPAPQALGPVGGVKRQARKFTNRKHKILVKHAREYAFPCFLICGQCARRLSHHT